MREVNNHIVVQGEVPVYVQPSSRLGSIDEGMYSITHLELVDGQDHTQLGKISFLVSV